MYRQLRNVLRAYAEHNPQVAYCQSMNFLVAVLLLVVDEETAFWCLAAIVERCMPGHFSTSMAMALVDQSVLCELLRHEDAQLVAHLEELQVPPSLVTTQWILTCFVGSSLPVAVLLRVWDAFFEHRHISLLFRVASALLLSAREAILATHDTGEACMLLTGLGKECSEPADADALLTTADALSMRSMLEPTHLADLRQRHALRLERDHSYEASLVARAAVATASATDAELVASNTAAKRASGGSISRRLGASSDATDCAATTTAGAAAAPLHAGSSAREVTVIDWRTGGAWALVPESRVAGYDVDGSGRGGSEEASSGGRSRSTSDEAEEWSLVEPIYAVPAAPSSSLSYVILQLEAPHLLEGHFGDGGLRGRGATASEGVAEAAARLDALARSDARCAQQQQQQQLETSSLS